jgi:hypothetical protein
MAADGRVNCHKTRGMSCQRGVNESLLHAMALCPAVQCTIISSSRTARPEVALPGASIVRQAGSRRIVSHPVRHITTPHAKGHCPGAMAIVTLGMLVYYSHRVDGS